MAVSLLTTERAPLALATATRPELRVLQVFSVLSVGGAETWLIALLRFFKENAHHLPVDVKLDILLTGQEQGQLESEAMELGARLFHVPFARRTALTFAREFRSILKAGKYHAIHDHQDYIAGIHFFMARTHLPAVRIAHVHNPVYHRNNYANDVVRRIVRAAGKQMIGRLATHVLGTSRQVISEYGLDKDANQGVVIEAAHCGFDVEEFNGDRREARRSICRELSLCESTKLVLFVGRLEGSQHLHNGRLMSHKNPEFALDVIRECIARDDAVRLLVVGAGEAKRRELETRVSSWGLSERIRFLGVRNDVPKLMLASNLLLFPSMAEGLGMVVVEAQAAGLPVLASDSTPVESVVVSDLVRFASIDDKVASWTDEALDLLSISNIDRESANRAVRNSAFSIENSARQLVKFYASGLPAE